MLLHDLTREESTNGEKAPNPTENITKALESGVGQSSSCVLILIVFLKMSMKKGLLLSLLACATEEKHQRKGVRKAKAKTKHQRSK